eukprot:Sspe_Gene.57209::Locus_31404_Transcript_1_1_Confidence_1.000_Length_471::g.57209::m.57209
MVLDETCDDAAIAETLQEEERMSARYRSVTAPVSYPIPSRLDQQRLRDLENRSQLPARKPDVRPEPGGKWYQLGLCSGRQPQPPNPLPRKSPPPRNQYPGAAFIHQHQPQPQHQPQRQQPQPRPQQQHQQQHQPHPQQQ